MPSAVNRLHEKLHLISRWVASAGGLSDWPAVLLLSVFRTRPACGSSIWARWARAFFPRVCFRPRALKGLRIGINPAELGNFVIYEEVFIENVYDLSKVQFEPDTIIDCGAYEGYFTLLAIARFPGARFLAFEPQPANHAALLENLSLNGLKVDARREAVSVMVGQLPFAGEGFGGHLCPARDCHASERVTVSNLCELIGSLASKRLLLKLDVEGEEAENLTGTAFSTSEQLCDLL